MSGEHSKTKTSYYRRIYVAFLIDSGINTVQGLLDATEMPKRTLQDTLKALSDLDIVIENHRGQNLLRHMIEHFLLRFLLH